MIQFDSVIPGLQHLYAPKMEEDNDLATVDRFRLTYDGPDLEIIERIRRMYERVPFGKGKNDEEDVRKKKKRRPKFLTRLKNDLDFRRKFILTIGLLWSFMILGWIIGQFGPSFLDLQIITSTTIKKGSAFMTANSVGYLTGSLLCGVLFDSYNKLLLLFIAVLGNAITAAIIPWCFVYEIMVIMHVAKGTFCGALDAICNAEIVYTWGEEGIVYMKALHFCFALGGIVSPMATAPFLAPKHKTFFLSKTPVDYYIPEADFDTVTVALNETKSATGVNFTVNTVTNVSFTKNITYITKLVPHPPPKSRIYIAYLLSALLASTAAIFFFVLYRKSIKQTKKKIKKRTKTEESQPKVLPLKSKIIAIANMMCIMGCYSAIEDTFAGFLATFCVKQMDWSKSAGSFATSFYWAAFGGGRFCGIFLVRFLTPVRMICMYSGLLIVAFTGLFLTSNEGYDAGVWICATLAGFALSIIFPTMFIWTEEELLTITGKVASLFLIASSSGTMVNPIVLGTLMDKLTPMWFCYLLFTESVLLLVFYLIAQHVASVIHTPNTEKASKFDDVRPVFYDDFDPRSFLTDKSKEQKSKVNPDLTLSIIPLNDEDPKITEMDVKENSLPFSGSDEESETESLLTTEDRVQS
ncbi:sodium-dependent glucose transporter 1A-like [Saccostrea cucullata]|uniref:sodium-dependent glucose transporter 1A-like n=1 Tax=Saccostrea cuccullata TaxID=36930 RepID=UPI002ECFCD3F